jgi:hypothetical protein
LKIVLRWEAGVGGSTTRTLPAYVVMATVSVSFSPSTASSMERRASGSRSG